MNLGVREKSNNVEIKVVLAHPASSNGVIFAHSKASTIYSINLRYTLPRRLIKGILRQIR
jgi:hypothetical protein